jgi:lysophospholipase L1-like esterase
VSALAAAALGASACIGSLCNAGALDPWFQKLDRLKAGVARPVHVLQIGDSHSAGDSITGAWRDLLQARYGAGGRGVLPPGRPYDGYLTRGAQVTMSPGWSITSDFGAAWSSSGPPLGLSAFSLTAQTDGASMSVQADPAEAFDRFTVCAIARPGSANLLLRAGAESLRFDLSSVTERPDCRTLALAAPTTGADLTVQGSGRVTVTSWATFRSGRGIAVSNLGVVGSQLVHFARTDDTVLTEELRAYRPDLIVVAFGTNEGFSPRFNAFEYEVTLRTQIGRLRRLAGNVPILLLGAPDALSRREAMRGNSGGEVSANCGTAAAPVQSPPPNVIASIMDRLRESVGRPQAVPEPAAQTPAPPRATATGTSRGPLFPPAALKGVRDVQRRIAAQLNVAFWDWEAAMGGRCSADAWVHAEPPLMRGDYVHYTNAGGQELVRRLQADLDRAAGL